jgi:hypothetical protein
LAVLLVLPLVSFAQTNLPPTVVIVTDKPADEGCIILGECAQFVVTVINPSLDEPDATTWYSVKVTVPIDPSLEITAASSTKGTAKIIGQTVEVNGGIELAPGESFLVYITACAVVPGPKTIVVNAYLEYEGGQGQPQDPVDTTVDPAVVAICPGPTPFVPEASTLILMGSAATGLTGYIGMQIRARRRRRD